MSTEIIFEDETKYTSFDEYINEQIKNQLDKNINEFKNELKKSKLSKDISKKLNNYIKKYNINCNFSKLKNDIINDINNNGTLFYPFLKDPLKQRIHENSQQTYLLKYNIPITKPKSDIRLCDGEFLIGKESNVNATKSIDFVDNMNNKTIYISCKYIKQSGGAQDNQYSDLCIFIKQAKLILTNKKYKDKYIFVCLIEGEYFTTLKIDNMIKLIDKYKESIKIFKTKEYILFKNNII